MSEPGVIFHQKGPDYYIGSNVSQTDQIPAGTYTLHFNSMMNQFFVRQGLNFKKPKKLYGPVDKMIDRFLQTYADRPGNTGILLRGEKGSGKTLAAKLIATKAYEAGIMTILINEPHAGEQFNNFLKDIKQPCVVIFDEFEKVYDPNLQKQLLTLLDGVHPSHKLFVFTSNDWNDLERHLTNRPGRIFYSIAYTSLEEQFIREYCQDNLDDKSHTDGIVRIARIIQRFNFDMLQALIEEMNRYKESPQEAISVLNIGLEQYGRQTYKIKAKYKGKDVPDDTISFYGQHEHPLTSTEIQFHFGIYVDKKGNITFSNDPDGDDEDEATEDMTFKRIVVRAKPTDLIRNDPSKGKFIFKKDDTLFSITREEKPREYTVFSHAEYESGESNGNIDTALMREMESL